MGEGLGLGNQVAISTKGGNNLAGVENENFKPCTCQLILINLQLHVY